MNDLFLKKDRTLVFLVGTYEYLEMGDLRKFPDIPQGRNNINTFFRILVDDFFFGIDANNIYRIENDLSHIALKKIVEICESDRILDFDSILFYYVGHGMKSPYDAKEWLLTFTETPDDERIAPQLSIAFSRLVKIFNDTSNIQHQFFIIDSCYSGLAGNFLGSGFENISSETQGTCLITSASDIDKAGSGKLSNSSFTDFTKELIKILSEGIDRKDFRDKRNNRIISYLDFKEYFKKYTKTKSNPKFENKLRKLNGEKIEDFPFFYNKKFSLQNAEEKLSSKNYSEQREGIALFKRILETKKSELFESEKNALKISQISLKIIDAKIQSEIERASDFD